MLDRPVRVMVVSRWLQMLVATLGGQDERVSLHRAVRIRGAGMPSHRIGICGNRPQPALRAGLSDLALTTIRRVPTGRDGPDQRAFDAGMR